MLWLLDEESIFPGASDESFIERIFVHHGDRSEINEDKFCVRKHPTQDFFSEDNLLKKSRRHNCFIVRHALGSYPVTYNVSGWLKLAQENPVTRSVLPLLQNSRKFVRFEKLTVSNKIPTFFLFTEILCLRCIKVYALVVCLAFRRRQRRTMPVDPSDAQRPCSKLWSVRKRRLNENRLVPCANYKPSVL